MHDSDDGREAQAWCALRNDDARLAFRLFLRLAMEGSANAQRQVAEMFFYGTGVREDEPLAARWYRTAAEQGHAEAQCDYAWCLDRGLGVARDRQQATMWLRRSAQQGNRSAQYALGIATSAGSAACRAT
jgi:TPR repeat protein